MKLLTQLTLMLLLALPAHGQSNAIKGTPVVDYVDGSLISPTYTAAQPTLGPVTGTNVTIDFSQPVTTWSTTNAPAVRFSFSNLPATSTNGPATTIQIISQVSTLLTNVTDTINWQGPWGLLNAGTNWLDVWWNGTALYAIQSPNHGVVAPAQITSKQTSAIVSGS